MTGSGTTADQKVNERLLEFKRQSLRIMVTHPLKPSYTTVLKNAQRLADAIEEGKTQGIVSKSTQWRVYTEYHRIRFALGLINVRHQELVRQIRRIFQNLNEAPHELVGLMDEYPRIPDKNTVQQVMKALIESENTKPSSPDGPNSTVLDS